MASSSSSSLQAPLKRLLTHLSSSPLPSSQITQHFIDAVTTRSALSPTAADNYSSLLEDLKERRRLQLLDAGAEVQLGGKESARRAAARAGLEVPEVYEPS